MNDFFGTDRNTPTTFAGISLCEKKVVYIVTIQSRGDMSGESYVLDKFFTVEKSAKYRVTSLKDSFEEFKECGETSKELDKEVLNIFKSCESLEEDPDIQISSFEVDFVQGRIPKSIYTVLIHYSDADSYNNFIIVSCESSAIHATNTLHRYKDVIENIYHISENFQYETICALLNDIEFGFDRSDDNKKLKRYSDFKLVEHFEEGNHLEFKTIEVCKG